MTKLKNLLLLVTTIFLSSITYAQVGVNTTSPQGILHLQNIPSKQMGLVMPRVDSTDVAVSNSNTTPVEATVVYDNNKRCLRLKTTDDSQGWSSCLIDETEVENLIQTEITYNGNKPARANKVAAADLYAATYIDPYKNNYVYGMGLQSSNQLGALTAGSKYPSLILGRSCKELTMGRYNGMAITTSGELWVWGQNSYGKNGTGNTTTVASPRQVALPGGVKAKKARTGQYNSLVLGEDNQLYVTGYNGYGVLGDGTTTGQADTFTKINFFNGMEVIDMDVFIYGAIAVTSDGNVYTWGLNSTTYRRIGLPTNVGTATTPTLLNSQFTLNSGEKVVKVQVDDYSNYGGGFITDQGRFFAFGYMLYFGGGSVYSGPTNLTPNLQSGERFTEFSMNNGVAFITNQNNIYGVGLNTNGRFGTGNTNTLNTVTSITPAHLNGFEYSGVSLGYNNMYLPASNKRNVLYGAGQGAYRQLGRLNESGSNILVPVYEDK
ncbi:hypothetical protein RAH57_11405 [Chryseobacterium sp. CKR4-1]|uniref:RCC1 domain-containing protein n=1 Tax=Chryseobacterium sp. CKR4-1 TaxID=3068896 RepID=UPI00279669A2|nr:hypothetical protein [Chryseobacterium sp. CKR4-1]MDQ1804594.1 hypothetical protein [Chryseobacterium sp. CKR4-1]WBV55302.1 hypothetical protein PFY10_13800 [Chryseobacterium daecheongense]